jgi:hypothetical protein
MRSRAIVTLLCLSLVSLAASADVKDDFLTLSTLPPLRQHHRRVLATVCGVWDHPDWVGRPEQTDYLHAVLDNFTNMCESGYEVHVVLVTYSVANASLTVPRHKFWCDRLATALPIAVARFDHEPLPDGTFGTGGTLASKHRAVFVDKVGAGYDLFISQEDDIMVKTHHANYFASWAHRLQGTNMYPGLIDYEVWRGDNRTTLSSRPSAMVDWRTKTMEVEDHGDFVVALPTVLGHSQRAYMLTQDMLANMPQDWVSAAPLKGEYNPYFNTEWLFEHFKVVLPVSHIWEAGIRHASDKYIAMNRVEVGRTHDAMLYARINRAELETVLTMCIHPHHHTPDRVGHQRYEVSERLPTNSVLFEPPTSAPCRQCFEAGAKARFEMQLSDPISDYVETGFARQINVTVACIPP